MRLKVITVALLLVAAGFASTQLRRIYSQNQPASSRKPQQPEVPTPIEEGAMTERQAKHSKLFHGYSKDVTRGRSLHEMVLEKGDVKLMRGVGDPILPDAFELQEYLQKLSCTADAIMIGEVNQKSSNVVEDGSFTFTEYQVVVTDVLKTNSTAQMAATTEITIVRVGGSVRLLNHVVQAIDESQKPLSVGNRYLFFLKFIPSTGAYRSVGSPVADDTFILDGNQIAQVSEQVLPLGVNRSADAIAFLNNVRAATNQSCGR